jgi:hypothetical protein
MNTIEPQMNVRVYFYIPFKDKDEAKKLGCRWDPNNKKWYCIDSDKNKSNISKCIQLWNTPEPYKIINDTIVLLSNIPDTNRGFTN